MGELVGFGTLKCIYFALLGIGVIYAVIILTADVYITHINVETGHINLVQATSDQYNHGIDDPYPQQRKIDAIQRAEANQFAHDSPPLKYQDERRIGPFTLLYHYYRQDSIKGLTGAALRVMLLCSA